MTTSDNAELKVVERKAPRSWIVALALFAFAATVYLGVAAERLTKASFDNHFSYLADSYLHGTLAVRCLPEDPRGVCPPGYGGNDWARYNDHWYVAFPSFPAVVYMPFVRAYGRDFPNVYVDCLIGASAPALLYLLLERLARRVHRETHGKGGRSWRENLAFSLLLAFGTVYFFCVVQGTVWFTAHAMSVPLAIGYLWFALGIDEPLGMETLEFVWPLRPLGFLASVRAFVSRPTPALRAALAGLFMGLLFHTRASFIYATPFFALEALRAATTPSEREEVEPPHDATWLQRFKVSLANSREWFRDWIKRVRWAQLAITLVAFGIPMLVALLVSFKLNSSRFGDPYEVGYRYLQIGWRDRIERWGLFNYHYLSRNLAVFLASLPWMTRTFPYVLISRHGLAWWFTTPHVLETARLRRAPNVHFLGLLLGSAGMLAMVDLLYQNSGWVQFGYRFSNDFIVFVLVALALHGRRVGVVWVVGLALAIAINLFGALSFDRQMKWHGRDTYFYDNDNSQQRYFQPD